MKNLLTLFAVSACFCSCVSTNLVHISVLEPAPVTLPAYIKNPGVVNRSEVTEQNKVFEVVDKVFSLEGAMLDKEGAAASMNGLVDELVKNNRFTGVKYIREVQLKNTAPGLSSAPLAWDIVDKICRENNTDALFTLELFDTDSKISYRANPVNVKTPLGTVPAVEHTADMTTIVKTGWRIYDPASRNILDEYPLVKKITFSGKGINPVIAASALIGRKDAVKQTGQKAGQEYAYRIIPYWVRVSRDYYVKGTDNFILAKRKAQTGNWSGAAELWQKETGSTNAKVAGRACYNMAIINEINGDIDNAIQWAQKAYEDYNNSLALRYVKILEDRKANNAVLKSQESE